MPIIRSLVDAIEFRKDLYDKGVNYINDEQDEIFVSYNQLYTRALDILYLLQSKGIKPGQELVFQIEDNEAVLYMFWACILGKIIPVPVTVGHNDEHREKVLKIWNILTKPHLVTNQKVLDMMGKYINLHSEFSEIYENMKSRVFFYEQFEYKGLQGEIQAPEAYDIAFIQFSSGSTGNPKGVTLTNDNIISNVLAMKEGWGFCSEDVSLSWMPLTHDMGMIAFHLTSLLAGIHQYIMPTKLFINKPVLWIAKVNEHRATWIFSPNFGYMYFLTFFSPEFDYGWDLSCIRYIINGAEPIVTELCDKFMEQLKGYGLKKVAMKAVYGLAEATVGVSYTPVMEEYRKIVLDRRFLETGQLVRQVEKGDKNALTFAEEGVLFKDCYVRICDNDGNIIDDYVVGNIEISGRNVTSGYYNNNEVTDNVMTDDGWLKTGDMGFMANGRLVCTGRIKDIIFINGQNYYPYDIERVAESFKETKLWNTAACGVFNKKRSKEDIVLFVAFKRKLDEFVKLSIQLKKYILECMGLYINQIIPIKNIPKTTSGKTQRFKLVERYNNGEFDLLIKDMERIASEFDVLNEKNSKLTETERNLLDIYTEVFETSSISIDDNFVNCGGNSLMLVQVNNLMKNRYPGKVTVANLFAYPTIKQLAKFIDSNDNLTIPGLKIPEKYFTNDRSANNSNDYEATIVGDQYNNLLKAAKSIGVKASDILLSMFIYLLKEISGESKIPVQVAIDSNNIMSVEIDFELVEDYQSFIQLVATKSSVPSRTLFYSPQDSYKARLAKNNMSIVTLFYNRGMLSMDTNLLQVYDLALEMYDINNRLELVFEFNKKLDGEMVKEIIEQYLWLTTEFVKKAT